MEKGGFREKAENRQFNGWFFSLHFHIWWKVQSSNLSCSLIGVKRTYFLLPTFSSSLQNTAKDTCVHRHTDTSRHITKKNESRFFSLTTLNEGWLVGFSHFLGIISICFWRSSLRFCLLFQGLSTNYQKELNKVNAKTSSCCITEKMSNMYVSIHDKNVHLILLHKFTTH